MEPWRMSSCDPMKTTTDPIDYAHQQIQRDALKFSVGRAMFCGHPDCEILLDWKRAVEISAWKGNQCISVKVFCTDCTDRFRPIIESKLGPLGMRLEVVDGRDLK